MHVCSVGAFFVAFLGAIALGSEDNNELQLLHVIFRHGIRTPADTYPNDPYVNETFSPVGWGQLTNDGKLLMYNNGLFVRSKYNEFLGNLYSPSITYVQSTDSDRTRMTAQLMDAAIWPPNKEQQWGPLDWQPVPVHYDPLHEDNLLLVRKPCAQYHLELEKVMGEKEVKQKLEENQELFNNLTKNTGMNIKYFDDVQSLYSTLLAEQAFNLSLPEWTKEYYPDKLLPLTEYSFVVNAYNDKLKRLKGGVLLRKILVDWYQKAKDSIKDKSELGSLLESDDWVKEAAKYGDVTNDRKLFLFAGHDSTISNLLSALNVWDPQVPGYGITILLELLKNSETNQYGVQIYLRNQTDAPPHKLTIPGCESLCSLEQLTKLVDPVIPRDWTQECKSDDPDYTPPPPGGP